MKNFLLRPREQVELFHSSFVYKKSGRYRYTLYSSNVAYHVTTPNEIFREVYLCAVLKYGMSVMKPEITDLQSLTN